MTQTPTPKFFLRPTPPQAGTPEYTRWSQDASLTYDGGSVTAAYGNLVQTFAEGAIGNKCAPSTKQVNVSSTTVTNTIGGTTSQRAGYAYTRKQWNKQNSSQAAGGLPIVIKTDLGEFEARLHGSMTALNEWLCANPLALFDSVWIYSPRDAQYGPFNPISS